MGWLDFVLSSVNLSPLPSPQVLEKSQRLLLQCAFPDAVARLQSTQLHADADDLWTAYFTEQQHSSLAAFVREILANDEPTFARKREDGFLVQVIARVIYSQSSPHRISWITCEVYLELLHKHK